MLKILGIVCLFAGFLGLSLDKINMDRQKLDNLREIRSLVDFLHGEISYSHIPIPDICKEYIGRCGGKTKVFLQELSETIDKEQGKGFETQWEDVLKKQVMKKEEKDCLQELGRCFGFSDIGLQLSKIERYRCDIDKKILHYEKNFQDNKKLILYFGVMSGLLLSIILL